MLDFEDGALTRRWLHGPEVDEPLAYERYAGTTAGGTGTALELFRNRLGSVILAVSVSTGAVAAEYDYDSFGQRTLVQGTEEVRYGFTSREHDARTGLIHSRARAYDPLTGQFLQRDPIGFASGDLNLYAYVENDPYNWTDPSGLTALDGGVVNAGTRAMGANAMHNIGMGVLGLATGITSFLTGSNALDTVLNQSGDGTDDERGIGDNDGPPLDDDPNIGPPDPLDPTSALLATLAATATISEGNANDRWHLDRHFEGTGIDSNVVREEIRNELGNLLRQGHLQEPGSQYVGTIQINGQTVEFRARHVPGRGINVGTAFPRAQ
nr:RHS repeat-associated core domain-containing protein [Boseongicola sp. H5]